MSGEREQLENLDEMRRAELEAAKSAFVEEAERRDKERRADYQRQVEAGLIDADKSKGYVEAVGRAFQDAQMEPPRDDQAQEAALREAQEIILSDQTLAWFTPSTPCPPNEVIDGWSWSGTWQSYESTFDGGTSAQDTLLKWQHRFDFSCQAWGGNMTSPLMAQAWGGGILRFKIPGMHIPFGKIEVTPYLNVQGRSRVQGGLTAPWYPQCGAWAHIEVQTRMGQGVAGVPYPWVKTLTPWTTPYTLWQEHSPPTKTQWGWHNVNKTGPVAQARIASDVVAGSDVYIDVMVNLMCYTIGGWAVAALYFDDTAFIALPSVCMKILAKYPVTPVYEARITPWSLRSELATPSPSVLERARERE
jgi:hypothetical protein